MPNIGDITYDTDPGTFIQMSDVESIVSEIETLKSQNVDYVVNSINAEMTSSLSPYACCLNGAIPLTDKAYEIMGDIDVYAQSIGSITDPLISAAEEHRTNEIDTLKQKLQEHIDELKGKLEAANQLKENLVRQWTQYNIDSKSCPKPQVPANYYDLRIHELEDEIRKYEKKLEEVNSLK